MLPERTTTIGDSDPVMQINAFHAMSAVLIIKPEPKQKQTWKDLYF